MPAGCLAESLGLHARCPFRAVVDLCCGALVLTIGVRPHDKARGHRLLAHRLWVGRREQDHDSHGFFDALVEARLHLAELALDPQDNGDSTVSRVVGALKPRSRLVPASQVDSVVGAAPLRQSRATARHNLASCRGGPRRFTLRQGGRKPFKSVLTSDSRASIRSGQERTRASEVSLPLTSGPILVRSF